MDAKVWNEFANRVDNGLRDGGVYADGVWWEDEYDEYNGNCCGRVLKIEINRGDWKHDHLRAEWIVENDMGINVKEWENEVTDEDGSDCYSAIHTLRFWDEEDILVG